MTIWQSKEGDLAWLVPFVSVRQMQINVHNTDNTTMAVFRPERHRVKILLGILFSAVRRVASPLLISFLIP
jgi:hypothetical protein